jgi:hypothetical protein
VDVKKGRFQLISNASIVVAITSRRIAKRKNEVIKAEMMALHEKPANRNNVSTTALHPWRIQLAK